MCWKCADVMNWSRKEGCFIVGVNLLPVTNHCSLFIFLLQITLRVNGGMHKSNQEFNMEFSNEDKPSLRQVIKDTCKRFGCKEKAGSSHLYNK